MTTKALAKPRTKKAPLPPVNLIVLKTFEIKKKDDQGADQEVSFDMPEIAQAASVALALLIEGGAKTWAEFMDPEDDTFRAKALSKVVVTDEIGELLDKFPTVLTWITRDCTPSSTIVVCPECKEFSVTLGTCPSSCKITPRCKGKPIHIARAKKPAVNKKKPSPAQKNPIDTDREVLAQDKTAHLDVAEQPDDDTEVF